MPTPAAVWVIDKLTSGDFKVKYPDNTRNGAPDIVDTLFRATTEELNKAYRPENFQSAPTTKKAKPMKKVYAETDPVVDILNYITKTKGIELTNTQIYLLIEILK